MLTHTHTHNLKKNPTNKQTNKNPLKNSHDPDLHYFSNKSNIKKSSNCLATTIMREGGRKSILNYPSVMKLKN